MKKVLYISYDGMTDPLGQSQVIPYLQKLTEKGFEIHVLSAEKPAQFADRQTFIAGLLQESKIVWHPIGYTKKPPILSTLKDVFALIRTAKKLHQSHGFSIVHCRSYIPALAGMALKKRYGLKFLFDMRGFYADERVDGNLWPQSKGIYRAIYRYFKKKERQFFIGADHTISLTYTGRDIIHNFDGLSTIPIEVIPCCADIELFDYHKTDPAKVMVLRQELGIGQNDYVICYLGSVGTWYMPDEMMHFFKILRQKMSNAKFLFITRDNPEHIFQIADKFKLDRAAIIIKPANREEVPSLISLCKASIFFIKPVFSKKASSPTKLAELLGMGVPVICNAGVGDIDRFVPDYNLGIMISQLDEIGFTEAVNKIDDLENIDPAHLRKTANELFSLEIGANRYYEVYQKLLAT